MGTLIVTLKNRHEMELVTEMLKKMRISVKQLSDEDREDSGLSLLMKQTDRSEKGNREQIINKLEE